MSESFDAESVDSGSASRGVSRRAVSTAAAWTVPAIAVATGAPLAAASGVKGVVVITPSVDFVRPGDLYPDILVTLHNADTSNIVNTTNATVSITLPAGWTWANGADPTVPRVFTGVSGGTLHLDGPSTGVIAPTLPAGNVTSGIISGTATEANAAPGNPTTYAQGTNTLKTRYIQVPPGQGGGNAMVWGENTNRRAFNDNTNDLVWASPVDTVPGIAGKLVDIQVRANNGWILRSTAVSTDPATAGYTMNTDVWTSENNNSGGLVAADGQNVVILQPGVLRPNEFFVSVRGAETGLTNYGRIFVLGKPTMPEFTFPVGTFITAITNVRASHDANTPGDSNFLTLALDQNRLGYTMGLGGSYAYGSGDGTFSYPPNQTYGPVPILSGPGTPLTDIVQLQGGVNGALALRADSSVWAWGDNSTGALGQNSTAQQSYAVPVLQNVGGTPNSGPTITDGVTTPLTGVTKLGQNAGFGYNTGTGGYAVIKGDGSLWTWGTNNYYRNNDVIDGADGSWQGIATLNTKPVGLSGSATVRDVAAIAAVICVILTDNTVWSWGDDSNLPQTGILGAGIFTSPNPVRVLTAATQAQSPNGVLNAIGFYDSNEDFVVQPA
ncbi:hypothetical protein HQQ81_01510 [Microbacteriaceae bacterium VKM Ac-2854]|nr:hypothetical protein [Microbacteriaceae bacterium VKM Ac-2854]